MKTQFGTYNRWCRRCDTLFESKYKTSKVCPKCYMPRGGDKIAKK